ncbi:MAG: ThuA domain-containing protein, partial [Lentisphaeria bacterium]|nr:ThuA domain-containing protein [Lentisphaeria bacterium]
DPGHPLAKAFRGQAFVIKDEIYQFKMPYSREKLRVLLSLDANHTDMTKKAIKRTDGDFAVSWIREFGRGRVFYLSLGHRHEIFWNEAVMQCYLDGIQYALGDLPCDATPSAQLSDAYLAQSRKKGYEEGIDAIFRDLAGYEMGRNDPRAKLVAAMVLKEQKASGSDIRADLSIRLARVAADAAATTDGRVFACRQLALIGMDNAIADLAGTLGDAKVGGWARRALEAIPGKAAGEALLTALPKHTGLVQAGIADSLGVRKVAQAVPALVLLLTSADRNVAAAAANALGRIGTREAAAALKAAPAVIAPAAQRALLACAGNLQSKAIYTELLAADVSPAVRAAAFEGKAVLDGAKSAGDVVAALKLPDVRMACAAANVMRQIDDTGFFARVVVSLPKFPSANQPFALDALAERGVRAAQSTVLALAERSPDASVKLAALRALEFVGDAKAV